MKAGQKLNSNGIGYPISSMTNYKMFDKLAYNFDSIHYFGSDVVNLTVQAE